MTSLLLRCLPFIVISSFSAPPLVTHAYADEPGLTWAPELIQGQLANGLRYVAYPSSQKSDPFNLRLIVQAGAIDETGPSGVAHAVEHMVFRETHAHPQTVHRYLAQLGWKTGLQVNAVTGLAHTQYMIRTRPDDALNLDGAMALLSQLALHPTFTEQSWQQERQIITEEMRQGENVASRINSQKKAITRNGSRYVERTSIGTGADLARISTADLQQFYQRHYRPANMLLVVAGHLDKATLKQTIERHFGQPDNSQATPRPYLDLPLNKQLYIGKIQDPKGTSSRVAMGMRTAQASRDTLTGKQQSLENYFLRRLLRDHVRRRAQALPAGISNWSMVMDEPTPARLTLAMAANTHDYHQGLMFVLQEQAYLRQHGLDQTLLDELKQGAYKQIASYPQQLAKRQFAQWEDKITEALLHSGPIQSTERYQQHTRQWLDALTIEQLNERLRTLLDAEDRFAYFQIPGGKSFTLPSAAAIHTWQTQANSSELATLPTRPLASNKLVVSTAPAIKAPTLPALKFPAASTDLGLPQRDPQQPVVRWQLANGDEIVWLNRRTQGGQILVRAQAQGGYQNSRYASLDSQTAVQIWQQSGFDFWSQQQNQAYFNDKQQPHWSWELKGDHLDLAAIVRPGQLPALLTEYGHYLQAGRIADYVLAEVRPQVEQARRHKLSAQANAWQTMQQSGLASHPVAPRLASLTQPAQLGTIANAHLQAPTRFYLVGELAEDEVTNLIQTYLTPIKRQPALDPLPHPIYAGQQQTNIIDSTASGARIRVETRQQMNWTPEQAFVLSSLNPVAQEALKEELRLKRAGVYSVRFEMKLDRASQQLISELSFSCAPERAEELQQAALHILSKLDERLDEQRLVRLSKDIEFAEQYRLQDDNTWLHRMILSHQAYGDMRYLSAMPSLARQIRLTELKSIAKNLFAKPNAITLISRPAPHITQE
ncbi:M16 family metallopeptidase [Iodobacter ciconiae]|uniref:Insulinase family protein n=1 Tax=Iodobacter ciconiae TaxID=2496266 RepID=A0A3S8ZUG5_9NEIS|nr:M16 family metallopeptidase [Iodobacter ciconiae]AZN37150.1 insulinase family protein [Iodobacter ciconiae]